MTHYFGTDDNSELISVDELAMALKAKQVQADSKPEVEHQYLAKATPAVFPEVNDLYTERTAPKPFIEADEQVDKTGIIDLYSERMRKLKNRR